MQSKIVLRARVPDGQGNFPFKNIEIKKGQPVPIPGATSYYLRYTRDGKRRDEAVGDGDLQKAYLVYANRLMTMQHEKLGLPTPAISEKVPSAIEISSAIISFLEEKEQMASRSTLKGYRQTFKDFRESCSKTNIAQIDRTDIIKYIAWMRENKGKHRIAGKGDGERNSTIAKHLRLLRAFLKHFGYNFPIRQKQWPKVPRKNPDRYSLENHIGKLLAVATEDEKDLIHFFTCSGFRDSEVAHSTYADINFQKGTVNIHEKPEYGFKIKDHEERPIDIPLPGWLLARLKARRDRYKSELIFPNADGRPNRDLLHKIQRIGKRAGLSVHVTLHKFRRTFGTEMAKKFGLRQAQAMLGHSNIATTQAYLAADEMDTAEARQGVEEVFSSVGD